MRAMRAVGALLMILTLTLLSAPGALAEPPLRLPNQVTDRAHALSGPEQQSLSVAVNRLYVQRQIRLWVVYVDGFSGQSADGWARDTARISDLGSGDALLAVATVDRSYAFLASRDIPGVSEGQLESLRRNRIEPALHDGHWADAALAAATGLESAAAPAQTDWSALAIGLAAIGVAVGVLVLVTRRLRQRRRAAAVAAAGRVDPTDAAALADVPLFALDELSKAKVVDVDNAVRTSANELALAVEEFGETRTAPFTAAVGAAKTAMTQAFTVRQRLDDAGAVPPDQRRELLTGVVVAAAKADRDLEAQRSAFTQLRDLVLSAPDRLDALTRQLVELTARIPVARQRLVDLHTEFDASALASVAGNVGAAGDRAAFAERNIDRARELTGHPVAGGQSALVDAVRAAESALAQGATLLDAVDSAEGDIRHAVDALPAAITETEEAIGRAEVQLQRGDGPHRAQLATMHSSALKAVAAARSAADPLAAFTALTRADTALVQLLDTMAEEAATAERLARTLQQALFTASARVRAVSDYIDTRRGSVGPEARTRLAEAQRRLADAQAQQATDVVAATTAANGAAALAAAAQSLAKSDVQAAQRAAYARSGDDSGAMLGGIIIGNILGGLGGGGGSRGSGGWSPTSFGGSDSGGGFLGGGGRF